MSMVPIILVTGWLHALALMHQGYWSTRVGLGVFWSTARPPGGHPVIFSVSRNGMVYLIRHGFECTRAGRAWFCTPNQIR